MQHGILAAAAGALLLLLPSAAPRGEHAGDYSRFREKGGSTRLMGIAREAFLTALGETPPLPRPSPETGRPAGPRDELPPPEWPDGPVGLALCLKVEGRTLSCEGGSTPPSRDLGAAITVLADRLARGTASGRGRLREKDRPRAALAAFFIPGAEEVPHEEWKRAGRRGGLDLEVFGLEIGAGEAHAVVVPGEAGSWRRAFRTARRRAPEGTLRRPETVVRFLPLPAGEMLLLSP